MKKIIFILTSIFCVMLYSNIAFGAATIDKTQTAKGLLSIKYDGNYSAKPVKLKVECTGNSSNYVYTIKTNDTFFVPLQLGDGEYKASVLENVSGTSYKVVTSEKFNVKIDSPNEMFLKASPIVNYNGNMSSIIGYNKFFSEQKATDTKNKVETLYQDIIHNYKYDTDKISGLPSDYVPTIDEMYNKKKGICYDYSSLLASVLRNNSIPTRLVMGYAPEVEAYHAWNEILINDKWVVVDTTTDASYVQAGHKTTMNKDAKLFKIVKIY